MSDMNFKIVEGTGQNYSEGYDEFVEMYNNPNITVADIRKKLGWSYGIYRKARFEALDKGDIIDRGVEYRKRGFHNNKTKKKQDPKYYYRDVNGTCIVKKSFNINNERIYITYGSYKNSEIADKVVAELKKVNWDKNYLSDIKIKLGIK